MLNNSETKDALISVMNGLFKSIEAENNEKSAELIEELYKS